MTPDQARSAARDILGARRAWVKILQRHDQRARVMPTFREFAGRYLDEEAKAKLKPRTVVNYEIYLRRHAILAIGDHEAR